MNILLYSICVASESSISLKSTFALENGKELSFSLFALKNYKKRFKLTY